MKYNILSKQNAGVREYDAPVCEVFTMVSQKVICTSETERVEEEDGEW